LRAGGTGEPTGMKVLIAARDPLLRSHLERIARERGHSVELIPTITDPKIYIHANVIFAHTESIAVIRKHASAATLVCALTDAGEDPLPALDAGADDWLEKASDAAPRFRAIEAKFYSSFAPALSSVPEIVMILDRNGRITFINHGEAEGMGTLAQDWVDPPNREVLSANLEKVFETGQAQHYELMGPPGETWYESTISPLFRDGKVTSAMIVSRDITAKKRVQGSEARFKAVTETIPDAVLLHKDGTTLWVNAACVTGLGYERPEELLGRSVFDFVVEEERALVAERMAAMRRTGQPAPGIELGVLRKDGSRATFELAPVQFVELEGERVSLIVARDITQKKEMQERLLVSERLASMGSLAACMAHEINNPLTYVIGNLSYVARALAEHLEDSSRSLRLEMALADAREGVERVRRIVSDLTALAQLESDEHRVIDLRRLLESTIGVAYNEIKHRARLEKSYAETPYVRANEVRLGQLFLDLLLCAARGIPEGAANDNVIAVTCGRDPSGQALLELRCRSSRPMEQAKDTAQSLTLAQRIVAGLDGELAIERTEPREMVLRVKLPAADGEPNEVLREKAPITSVEVPPRLQRTGNRARILVVDDEPVIASTMRRALEGHDIYIVTSGRDALELCRGQAFDLVLCDLMMPDLTGMDLYEQLRRDAAGNEKRIIFMTGGAFTPRAKSFLAKIPNAWVEKPFDFDQIQSLVDQYIQSSRTTS
jgi:two-component system, cell cycle sensor histidine kinase and response regulator CckA